jgi:two-component system response regulator AtoC
MIRKVLFVGKCPEAPGHLAQSMASWGIQIVHRSSLRAAASVFETEEGQAMVVVLDGETVSSGEADLLAKLNGRQFPLSILLFGFETCPKEVLRILQTFPRVRLFSASLEDPTACASILNFINVVSNAHADTDEVLDSGAASARSGDSLFEPGFLRRVGRSDVPVLLHGETGVGKEVMARRLWGYSLRTAKPLLKLNCAALPSELVESELFGYEKGAFTGATMDKPGKFELAHDGTILLDEIGDMDLRLQAKLLQVLQDGEVQPLGSSRTVKVNVRIMAATHRNLRAAIAQGTFREDLYYRLSVINITIAPLRERSHEIIPLAEQLLARHTSPGSTPPSIPDSLKHALLALRWPGNVRELENVMRRYLVYQDAALILAELACLNDTDEQHRATVGSSRPPQSEGRVSFDHFAEASRSAESKLLLDTLESVRWNRRQAAIQLNIDYKALLYKLQKHGIVESKTKRREATA